MYQRLLEHLTTAVLLLDGELRVRYDEPGSGSVASGEF